MSNRAATVFGAVSLLIGLLSLILCLFLFPLLLSPTQSLQEGKKLGETLAVAVMIISFLLVINAGWLLNQIDKTRQSVASVKTEIIKQREQLHKTVFCTLCGTPMSSDSKFCRKCGTPLLKTDTKSSIVEEAGVQPSFEASRMEEESVASNTKTCPKCGAINDAKYKFCFRCGTRLPETFVKPSEVKTEVELPPPPPPPPDIEKRIEELECKIRELEESLKRIIEEKSPEIKDETSIFE